jgi:hypothetical protein
MSDDKNTDKGSRRNGLDSLPSLTINKPLNLPMPPNPVKALPKIGNIDAIKNRTQEEKNVVLIDKKDITLQSLPAPPGSPGSPGSPKSAKSPSLNQSPAINSEVQSITVEENSPLSRLPSTDLALDQIDNTERSIESIDLDNYDKLLEESSVENELIKLGYQPVRKFFVRGEDGNLIASNIEVRDDRGQHLYVELDTDGYVSYLPDDVTIIRTEVSGVIPDKLRQDMTKCADGICGVSFKCENGLCTSLREGKKEDFIILDGETDSESQLSEGHHLAYPMVKLSDIKKDKKQTVDKINTATRNIRKGVKKHCLDELTALKTSINNLSNIATTFTQKFTGIFNTLDEDISKLESFYDAYNNMSTRNVTQEAKFKAVIQNLAPRYEKLDKLLSFCSRIVELTDALDSDNAEVKEYVTEIDKYFNDIDKNYLNSE